MRRRSAGPNSSRASFRSVRFVVLFCFAVLSLFFAVQLLGASMRTLSPAVRPILTRQTGPLSFVGISWLSAYVMLNGSIVAAIALSLYSADLMTVLELFLLVAGSRLGAAGIVLLIGALEYLRASEYSLPEAMRLGTLTFLVNQTIYVPATVIGATAVWFTERCVGTRRGRRRSSGQCRRLRAGHDRDDRPLRRGTQRPAGRDRPRREFSPHRHPVERFLRQLAQRTSVRVSPAPLAVVRFRVHHHRRNDERSVLDGPDRTRLQSGLHPTSRDRPVHHGCQYRNAHGHPAGRGGPRVRRGIAIVLLLFGAAAVTTVAAFSVYDSYYAFLEAVQDALLESDRAFAAFIAMLAAAPFALVIVPG